MSAKKSYEVWFVTGSQHLYGQATLDAVARNSRSIVDGLTAKAALPAALVFKPVVTTADAITAVCQDANNSPACIGLVMWMHTFSPAKMWIEGLTILQKPFVHLHTQFNRDIPWASIDMDYMNLHQSAHGDREFGFICTRMKKRRKVIVGHWEDASVQRSLALWMRVAAAWHEGRRLRVARFGDNMRDVAVTEGDKVEAQMRFGYTVSGYGVGDLVRRVREVGEGDVDRLVEEYSQAYALGSGLEKGGKHHANVREGARIELGLRAFLDEGKFGAFTTTFEDLAGLSQLPGLAVQRLMADGYGFGAEGDWKTAALLYTLKAMAAGLPGGASFMEDYTYHLNPAGKKVLGAHMLEVCPSIAADKPRLEVHPLGIGGKDDPPRLVFNVKTGPALNVSLIDLGSRFRLLVNEVDVVPPDADLPRLPVARATWKPRPDFETAATAWILGGGAHHTVFTQALTSEHILEFAELANIECVLIDGLTSITALKKELRWNESVSWS